MVERMTIRRVPFGPEDRRPAAEQLPGCQAARGLFGVPTSFSPLKPSALLIPQSLISYAITAPNSQAISPLSL